MFIAWSGAAEFYGVDLVRNSGVKTKNKVFGAKSWACFRLSLVFFVQKRYYYDAWGGTSSILGGIGSEMHFSDTGLVTFFWGTILAPEHISRLGDTSSDLGGTAPKCSPRSSRLQSESCIVGFNSISCTSLSCERLILYVGISPLIAKLTFSLIH